MRQTRLLVRHLKGYAWKGAPIKAFQACLRFSAPSALIFNDLSTMPLQIAARFFNAKRNRYRLYQPKMNSLTTPIAIDESTPSTAETPRIHFDNSYARELEGFYVPWQPAKAPAPRTLFYHDALAHELRIAVRDADVANVWSGNALPHGATPIAQVYAGHQFGHFSPQLGDGRALLLGEVIDTHGVRRDIAFKGSGRTPFSRRGDGKAAVGPMLREVLISEAMHALGIPTTRALAVVATGEPVHREETLPGAVLTRVAQSHIRVGTFEYFAARGEFDRVKKLADYTIARHYPSLQGDDDRYAKLLREFAQRQAALIAKWMNVGFIHGVMNTDNMTLSGETIDYGPCAFMEAFDPAAVFSSIDTQGRYAYGNQPNIARWNIAKFAEAVLPLMLKGEGASFEEEAVALANQVLSDFPDWYAHAWLRGQRAKLGLSDIASAEEDAALANDFLQCLRESKVDYTLGYRALCDAADENTQPLTALFAASENKSSLQDWLVRWRARLAQDVGATHERAKAMRGVNPVVIPRNHLVEAALKSASAASDMTKFDALLDAITRPFDASLADTEFARPAPAEVTACYQTFCGT